MPGLPDHHEPNASDDPPPAVPAPIAADASDDTYFDLLARAVRICARYKPKFGTGKADGLSLAEFQALYGADPFYNWVGLNSPGMYAAHKAAGGMTSIYRQLGIGCQWIFFNVLQNTLRLTPPQASWTYQVPTPTGKPRSLSLDGRIDLADLTATNDKARLEEWMTNAASKLLLPHETRRQLNGIVFEVRQGYKSMDSKRQNADIANAANAYSHRYMPVLVLLSTQIDANLIIRYTQAQWLLLVGTANGDPIHSTYSFCREVLNYDLAGFFERNSARIRAELETVLTALLEG